MRIADSLIQDDLIARLQTELAECHRSCKRRQDEIERLWGAISTWKEEEIEWTLTCADLRAEIERLEKEAFDEGVKADASEQECKRLEEELAVAVEAIEEMRYLELPGWVNAGMGAIVAKLRGES